MSEQTATPVAERERIASLDVLRGFALLGILIMNIQAFAMPSAAYSNPAAYGDLDGVNGWVWILSHVFADQKFMAIFSMLFGAGVCLFSDRAIERTGRSAGAYYRRNLVLLVVGILHGYLLFYGDILFSYAMCALWVYLMRNRSPRTLLIVASLLLAVPLLINALMYMALPEFPPEAVEGMRAGWAPPADQLEKVVTGTRGTLSEQIAVRAQTTITLQTIVFLLFFVWRVSGMMLVGMALYKWGTFSAKLSGQTYTRIAMVGLPVGLAGSATGVHLNFANGWSLEYSMFLGASPNYLASIAVALGYVSLVMLAVQRNWLPRVQQRLAATGRMAFTNYLAQSLICTTLFNELGLFGDVERWQQLLVVVAVWALQLWYSPAWLARYRYGPLEWLWRTATYARAPALRR